MVEQTYIMVNSCLVCPEEITEFSETVLSVFAVGCDDKHLVLNYRSNHVSSRPTLSSHTPSSLYSSNLTPQFSVVSL